MTSVSIKVGMGNDEKSSSRVLKPPGGECSGIFGDPTPSPPKDKATRPNPANTPKDKAARPNPAAAIDEPAPSAPKNFAAPEPIPAQITTSVDPAPVAAKDTPVSAIPAPDAVLAGPTPVVPIVAAKEPATAPKAPIRSALVVEESKSSSPAVGLRSERQKLFGPAETSADVHRQSYNYRNQSSIVFGGVGSNQTAPGKATSHHQPCVKIRNPPGGKSSGIF